MPADTDETERGVADKSFDGRGGEAFPIFADPISDASGVDVDLSERRRNGEFVIDEDMDPIGPLAGGEEEVRDLRVDEFLLEGGASGRDIGFGVDEDRVREDRDDGFLEEGRGADGGGREEAGTWREFVISDRALEGGGEDGFAEGDDFSVGFREESPGARRGDFA